MRFLKADHRRVAHMVYTCFHTTETFVYDFVTGCRRFEAWCLAEVVCNQQEFPFPRVESVGIRWESNRPWDLVDRAIHRLWPGHRLPIYRALFKIRPALIHAHFGPSGHEILPYCQRFGIPVLTSFYGYDASSLPKREGWMARLQNLFQHGTAFAVEGPAMKQRLASLGCPPEKIYVLPITIHLERYTYRPRKRESGQPIRILFVGRFVAKKGLAVLLKALAQAAPQLGECELRIIGGGEEEAAMRELAQDYGIAAMTRFLGFQPRAVVVEEMNQAHILAVPSQTAPDGDTEGGAPTVVIEAQACGLPVASTNHADIPFVAAPAYREFLAQEGSAESFAEKLVALGRAADAWPALAEAGRDHVAQQHGPTNFDHLEDLYEQLILDHQKRTAGHKDRNRRPRMMPHELPR
jgi:colanic acid/amylovoran biosynthesis glycosyltransferase